MLRRQITKEPKGVRERIEEVFRRCSPDLHRYVQRRLQRPADSADLTQEIFERFIRGDWRARARNPHAYLFGIASNVVADAKMAQRREFITYDSAISEKAGESLTASGGDTDSVALQEEIGRALEQLSDMHRAVLLLTKRDGLSCREAAARMGIAEGSVRVYVCEARAKLKMLLKRG